MGAKSTMMITRQAALSCIMKFLEGADNDTLSRVLEELNDVVFGEGRYEDALGLSNFSVID